MRKITKFQRDFNCLPYSFFVRKHQYSRTTTFYETEVIHKTRTGNDIVFSYDDGSHVAFLRSNAFIAVSKIPITSGISLKVKAEGSGMSKDLDKYMDVKLRIFIQYGRSAGLQTAYDSNIEITRYLSSYSYDENDDSLFFGYDHDGLDGVEVRDDKDAKQWRTFIANSVNAVKGYVLLTLSRQDIIDAAASIPTAFRQYFRIVGVKFEFYQRRYFYDIEENDTDGPSIKFGEVQRYPWEISRDTFKIKAKNEIIEDRLNVKKRVADVNYNFYAGYYTTDKAVFPITPIRQLSTDTAYKKAKKRYCVVDLYPDNPGSIVNISLTDDTNPDAVINPEVIQSFSFGLNDEGLPFLIDKIGPKAQIELISSTATPDLVGNEVDVGCADYFVFEKYYFDKYNVRNNKVIKITVIGRNDMDETGAIRLCILTEVVKNTTIYESYSSVSKL